MTQNLQAQMNWNHHLSVVIPVYYGQESLAELVARLKDSLSKITENYEIILVDDDSPDHSWKIMESIANADQRVRVFRLSRNFGQHYAISCGLANASGEWTVVMDCDLQDRPEEIIKLYQAANKQELDIVLARRFDRKDKSSKKFFSIIFYRVLYYLTGLKQDESVANFGIYHHKVITAVLSMPETICYFPSMVQWVGFRSGKIDVQHSPRINGTSSYNFKRLLRLATDIMLAYSDKPLRIVVKTGIMISSVSILVCFWYYCKWLSGEVIVLGYASLIISIWLLSGIIIATLGVIGLYVGKIFEGVKNRPSFIVAESIND
ncbi:MAG: glycosyltransferase family 2 protein [Bacteroidota bacterium]